MANEYDNRGPASRFGIGPDDRTYIVKRMLVAAGAEVEVPGLFDWCEILASDFDTLSLSYNDGRSFQELPRGLAPTFPRTKILRLRNDGGADASIEFGCGLGEPPRDSRLVVVNGTNVAVQGIPAGVPVIVEGVAGGVPIATQDDPLPAVAMQSAFYDVVAIGSSPVFTALQNVNGAWIYYAETLGQRTLFPTQCGFANATTGAEYLRAPPASAAEWSQLARRDRPWFVPAGQAVDFVARAAGVASIGFINWKLVP